MAKKDKKTTVFGVDAPPPRITWAGYRAIAIYIALPIFAVLLALDLLGYLAAKSIFKTCYGVLCLF